MMTALPYLRRGLGNPETIAISGVSAQFTTLLAVGKQYVVSATVDCWVAIGTNPTAVLHGASSAWLARGDKKLIVLDGATTTSTKVAVVIDAVAGYATIEEVLGGA
jgi:hypothetical protein